MLTKITKTEQFNRLMRLIIHGLLIVCSLIILQTVLDSAKDSFMMFLPPLGFAFFYITTYLIGPLIIGAVNIIIIHRLNKLKGWQVGFWLNGLFLMLVFSTTNLVLQTMLNLPFAPYIALIDLFLLSLPFGIVARYSNGGWKKPID
ncbi:MAG: hypothetical protein ACQCN5_04545 [Candidatus Bathyarchaeia archaeon]|jgi:hypothetical protein